VTLVLAAQQLWEDGKVGSADGDHEVLFDNAAEDQVYKFLSRMADLIGEIGEGGVRCDAIDLTLSVKYEPETATA
jgi:hypothetical protein